MRTGRFRSSIPSPERRRGVISAADGGSRRGPLQPRRHRVLHCRDHAVRIRDPATGRLLFSPMWHVGANSVERLQPRRPLRSQLGWDRTVRLWDLATASPDRLWLPHTGAAYGASFSPDGRMLATAENNRVRLWDAATGMPSSGLPCLTPTSFVAVCRFSPDGRFLLTMSGEIGADQIDTWIWDMASRKVVAGPLRHQFAAPVSGTPLMIAVWSPDGRRIATAAHARQVRRDHRVPGPGLGGADRARRHPGPDFRCPGSTAWSSARMASSWPWPAVSDMDHGRHGEVRLLDASTGQPESRRSRLPASAGWCGSARMAAAW